MVKCVAVCCSVLQCVAVCCSVLQCVILFNGHQSITISTHLRYTNPRLVEQLFRHLFTTTLSSEVYTCHHVTICKHNHTQASALRVPTERFSYVLPREDFGRMIFQKDPPLGSISRSNNVPWWQRSAAPEQIWHSVCSGAQLLLQVYMNTAELRY